MCPQQILMYSLPVEHLESHSLPEKALEQAKPRQRGIILAIFRVLRTRPGPWEKTGMAQYGPGLKTAWCIV